MIANFQQQYCKEHAVSISAKAWAMDGLETDTKLIHELCAWSGKRPSALAGVAGLAATTITRIYNGSAKTRISQPTLDKLRASFPDFPGWAEGQTDTVVASAIPPSNAQVLRYEGGSAIELLRDIPIFGTSLGAPQDFDGKAIEQTMLNTGEVIGYLPRPTVLNGQRGAYGLYVQGTSMAPRHEDGDTVFVQDSRTGRPPRIGDDIVVYLRDGEDEDLASAVLIKRLRKRTSEYVELEQFNPPISFRIEASAIFRIDRVIPWSELLS